MSDLISRQAAIEKFEPWLKVDGYSEGELNMLKAVLYELRFLPSAQPERKKGKWITDDLSGIIHCNQCRSDAPMETTGGGQYKSNYCPHCGADMIRK